MPKIRKKKDRAALSVRRQPLQQRSRERTQQILDITAKLLDEVGFDDLNTTLIAEGVGISVGSLYHYFPNKHAILFVLGTRWLEEMTIALEDTERLNLETLSLEEFVDRAVERMLLVYQQQQAILPLARALWAIPELREIDVDHDQMIINRMVGMYKRLGVEATENELARLGRLYLELTHSLLLVVVEQKSRHGKRTLSDLKHLVLTLLSSSKSQKS